MATSSPTYIQARIEYYAIQYEVSAETLHKIVKCESGYDPLIQSGAVYKKDRPEWGVKAGDRELSFGLVQIHLPSHPSISREEAQDVEFSLEFLAKNVQAGRAKMWSCA